MMHIAKGGRPVSVFPPSSSASSSSSQQLFVDATDRKKRRKFNYNSDIEILDSSSSVRGMWIGS
jgi:hypothetical protein